MSNDYLKDSERTASQQFHEELVNPMFFIQTLEQCSIVLQNLDKIKKALYYGRQFDHPDVPYDQVDGTKPISMMMEGLSTDSDKAEKLLHGIIGIATEAGEMLEALLKAFHEGALDVVNLDEEIGDQFWYQAMLLRETGNTFENVQKINIEKLKARFPEKFTEENANNRDLDTERKILEQKN